MEILFWLMKLLTTTSVTTNTPYFSDRSTKHKNNKELMLLNKLSKKMVRIIAKKTNAQFSIEFVVLVAFMFLVFLVFISIMTSNLIESKETEAQETAEDIATLVSNEVYAAKPLSDGYTRTFELPNKINGNEYDIEIIDDRELVVNYLDEEYVYFLPEKVEGNVDRGLNRVEKIDGIVYLEHISP